MVVEHDADDDDDAGELYLIVASVNLLIRCSCCSKWDDSNDCCC